MGDQQVQHDGVRITVGTLGAIAAVTASLNIDAARVSGVLIKKWMAAMSHSGLQTGDGPIIVGYSQDLSATEVAECLNADPQGDGDIPATERGNRKVVPVWVISQGGDDAPGYVMPARFRWPWPEMKEGTGLQMFVYNAGMSPLSAGLVVDTWNTWVQEWFD